LHRRSASLACPPQNKTTHEDVHDPGLRNKTDTENSECGCYETLTTSYQEATRICRDFSEQDEKIITRSALQSCLLSFSLQKANFRKFSTCRIKNDVLIEQVCNCSLLNRIKRPIFGTADLGNRFIDSRTSCFSELPFILIDSANFDFLEPKHKVDYGIRVMNFQILVLSQRNAGDRRLESIRNS
jgi:hypothetical protein